VLLAINPVFFFIIYPTPREANAFFCVSPPRIKGVAPKEGGR